MNTTFFPTAENPFATIDNIKSVIKSAKAEFATTASLGTYALKTELDGYAKKADVDGKLDALTKALVLKGTATKEELATIKETAKAGELYVVTDDSNHLYLFLGAEAEGADANGFLDLGVHIDLSGYAKTTDLATKVDKVEGSSLATEAQLAQIETNKTDIAGLKTSKADLTALDDYVKTEALAGYVTTDALDSYATTESLGQLTQFANGFTVFEDTEMQELWANPDGSGE